MIVDQANRRNQLLYASNAGYPTVQFEDSLIIEKHSRVRKLGLLTIAILQDKTQQILVRQCIEIVLSKLDNLTPTGYDYELPEANFQF